MIVWESGHDYQVRITPHPQECHWSRETVDSMLPGSAALPDSPTPLPKSQPSTASGGGLGAAGHTSGTGRRRGGSTWKAGSNWRPSPNASGRGGPQQRPTCAMFARSTRSGRWQWGGNCSPPSALRRKPKRHTQPLCTRCSVPSAAPACGVWETTQGPEPPRAEIRNTPP